MGWPVWPKGPKRPKWPKWPKWPNWPEWAKWLDERKLRRRLTVWYILPDCMTRNVASSWRATELAINLVIARGCAQGHSNRAIVWTFAPPLLKYNLLPWCYVCDQVMYAVWTLASMPGGGTLSRDFVSPRPWVLTVTFHSGDHRPCAYL